MNGILYRWIGRISAYALFGAVLGLFLCATANASGTAAGTSTKKAQSAAEGSQSTPDSQTDNKQPGSSCEGPQFQFKGWIGGRDSKTPGHGAGWPRILILKSADSSMRRFQIQVCLPQKNYSAQAGTSDWASGTEYPDTLKLSE